VSNLRALTKFKIKSTISESCVEANSYIGFVDVRDVSCGIAKASSSLRTTQRPKHGAAGGRGWEQ